MSFFFGSSLVLSFLKIYMSLGGGTWYWCKTASHWWAGHQHETGNSCQGDNRGFKRERSGAVLFSSLWSRCSWCGSWSHNPMCWETGACGAHNCLKCERNQEKPQVITILFNVQILSFIHCKNIMVCGYSLQLATKWLRPSSTLNN